MSVPIVRNMRINKYSLKSFTCNTAKASPDKNFLIKRIKRSKGNRRTLVIIRSFVLFYKLRCDVLVVTFEQKDINPVG
jgi:hypothetical protein